MEFAASAAVAPADSVSIGAFFEVGHGLFIVFRMFDEFKYP